MPYYYLDTSSRAERQARGDRYNQQAQRILEFIRGFWLKHGYSPSVREITLAAGFTSTSVANYWLKQMRTNGHLLYEDNINRSFRIPGQTVHIPTHLDMLNRS
ncbi:MAG TPA: hypothetical protein VH186_18930 [Chloroflexia bacterium]|nr:hypothetical protein [Chloroflexia bacterium]